MRILFLCLFSGFGHLLFAQVAAPVFNNQTTLKDGFYSSVNEILKNKPICYKCRIDADVDIWFGRVKYFYTDTLGVKREFKDTALLIVRDNQKYVFHKRGYHRISESGALSVFIIRTVYTYDSGIQEQEIQTYFWDFLTGSMLTLNASNMEVILKRDPELYILYSALSRSKKKKEVFKYLLQFNARNPIELIE